MTKRLFPLLFTAILAFAMKATFAQGIMTTILGDTTIGLGGDGGPANLASISGPHDVAMDAAGNLYFVDQNNKVIRKVAASTGIISRVAGIGNLSGTPSGVGGPATAAQLAGPLYLCLDASDNVYFTDSLSIKKVDHASGILSLIAGNDTMPGFWGDGGPATAAWFNYPQGLCADAAGNIYVADEVNSAIRKISPTGVITRVAGDGTAVAGFAGDGGPATAATLNNPSAVALDHSGNLYIVDMNNFRIREVSALTGIITTIAGGGPGGFGTGPATNCGLGTTVGICVDDHGDIYIDDISCSCRKIHCGTGIIDIVAGDSTGSGYNGDGGLAVNELLNEPMGLCVDRINGNIIIADYLNNRIRMATQPGYMSALGVSKTEAYTDFNIYPNPSTGRFMLQALSPQNNTSVEVYSALGLLVYTGMIAGTQGILDLSDQPTGNYFIRIRSATAMETKQVSVVK